MKYIRTEEGVYAFKEGMKIRCFYLNYGTKSVPYLIFDDKKQNVEFLGKVIKQALLKTQFLEKENAEYKRVLEIIFGKEC